MSSNEQAPPSQGGGGSNAESQARRHVRTCVVEPDGVATIKITLEGVLQHGPLVLATLAPPYCQAVFPDRARANGRPIPVIVDTLSRGLKVAYIDAPPQAVHEFDRVEYEFRVSNAIPFLPQDVDRPHPQYWQAIGEDATGRSYVLRLQSAEFVLRMQFIHAPHLKGTRVRVIEESRAPRKHGVGATWTQLQEHVVNGAWNDKSVTFEKAISEPTLGRRYGFALSREDLRLKERGNEDGTTPSETAAQISKEILTKIRSRPSAGAPPVSDRWVPAIREAVAEALTEADNPCPQSLCAGFLWDDGHKMLRPIFGSDPYGHLGVNFEYGEGVAGHAFRFEKIATFNGEKGGLIFLPDPYDHARQRFGMLRRGEAEGSDDGDAARRSSTPPPYAWIVCVPLRFGHNGPAVGVVSFAGTDTPTLADTELADFARSAGSTDRLAALAYSINQAFWKQVIAPPILPDRLLRPLLAVVAEWDQRSSMPTGSRSRRSTPSPIESTTRHATLGALRDDRGSIELVSTPVVPSTAVTQHGPHQSTTVHVAVPQPAATPPRSDHDSQEPKAGSKRWWIAVAVIPVLLGLIAVGGQYLERTQCVEGDEKACVGGTQTCADGRWTKCAITARTQGPPAASATDRNPEPATTTDCTDADDCYSKGGFSVRLEQHVSARLYYRAACNLGHKVAFLRLGTMLYKGEGGEADRGGACRLWEEGCGLGDAECCSQKQMLCK